MTIVILRAHSISVIVFKTGRIIAHKQRGFKIMSFLKYSLSAAILLTAACTNTGADYTPIVDGPTGPNFNADLAQCQQLSQQQAIVDGDTAATAATAAGVAGASSVIFNGNSSNLGEAAAVGALTGLASGSLRNNREREEIIRRCMRGRGYNVVG